MDVKIILKIHPQQKQVNLLGFSTATISSFKSIESKHDLQRAKDCMKKFYESIRKHEIGIISFKKKKIKVLTNEQKKSSENVKIIKM